MDIFNGVFTNKFSERQPEMSASLQTRITSSTYKQIMLAALVNACFINFTISPVCVQGYLL